MYKRSTIEEYQSEWVKAERELAINSLQNMGWFPFATQTLVPDKNAVEPAETPNHLENEQTD